MEGIEKTTSLLEKAKFGLSYWLAEREANNLNDRYEGKMQMLSGAIADALGSRGLDDPRPGSVSIDDPHCIECFEQAERAIEEVRAFEREKLGMSKDSPELKRAIEDLALARSSNLE